jgi:putative hydrolase of the HAD superfamily
LTIRATHTYVQTMRAVYRAVLFDIGGVVVGSPLDAIARYERDQALPAGFVNRVVVTSGARGAWARLERGELTLETFYPAFEADCDAAGCRISARELMRLVAASTEPRPAMLAAIRRIRERGILTGAVTNNWISEDGEALGLRPYFDAFVESARVGLRKPDPRIFELACAALVITPDQAVVLDDIGANLKSARALGMTTIKVVDPDMALAELEVLLGIPLR